MLAPCNQRYFGARGCAYTCVLVQRILFLTSVCFYEHLLILSFARSSQEGTLILFAVARLPNRRFLMLQQRDGLFRIFQVSEQSL